MDFLQFKPTQTISVNPPGGTHTAHPHHSHHSHLPLPTDTFPHPHARFLHTGEVGHKALWVIFFMFAISFVLVGVMALRVEKRARVFHWISAAVLGCAMFSYFAMANDMGVSFVSTHYDGKAPETVHLFREIYWARYVDWLFTTPMLLVSLSILAGLSPADALLAIVADVVMIVTGLFGALTQARWHNGERTKWAWFAMACAAFLVIWYVLIAGGIKAAKLRSSKTRGLFYILAGMTLILWTGYPIVWGLAEGSNKISVDAEIIVYGVHDVLAKIVFTFILLAVHTHGDGDTYVLPDWFVTARKGQTADARDGRGSYGAIRGD